MFIDALAKIKIVSGQAGGDGKVGFSPRKYAAAGASGRVATGGRVAAPGHLASR